VQIDVPNEISLPKSKSVSMNNQGVLVQVSESKIWVDRVLIFDTANMPANFIDDQGRRIVPLYDELVKKREGFTMLEKSVPNAKPFSGLINLVVDKSIKYSYLKKLMYTAAQAGFREYKFVVRGQEQ
jgi:biopolymer transport protein ExbD